VWVLNWLDEGDDAEGNDEEDSEDNEGDQLRELKSQIIECAYRFVDVALVGEVETGQLHWEPDNHTDN
jgi:hypothetical protein